MLARSGSPIFRKPEPLEKAALQKRMRMDSDRFDKALDKLWIHGSAVTDSAETRLLVSQPPMKEAETRKPLDSSEGEGKQPN
jgi:hypothetical protein